MTFTEGKDKKQYLRVVNTQAQTEVGFFDLTGMKKHGLVHANGQYGALQFSNDESRLLYVAEKEFKTSQFFDADLEWNDEEKMTKANLVSSLLLAGSVSSLILCIHVSGRQIQVSGILGKAFFLNHVSVQA